MQGNGDQDMGVIGPKPDMYIPPVYPDLGPIVDSPPLVNGCTPAPLTSATGKVYAPNQQDPISGATIYTLASAPAPLGSSSCEACLPAPPGSLSHTNSAADGSFSIEIPTNAQYLVIELGHFRRVIPVSTLAMCAPNNLTVAQSSFPAMSDSSGNSVPKIAVTTGSYDHMQNVILKLGLDAAAFDVYDGKNLSTTTTPVLEGHCGNIAGNMASTPIPCSMDQLLNDLTAMEKYDIILIDCGDKYQASLLAGTGTAAANIEQFISKGGRLFVDDQSYEYVEQAFPEVFSWEYSPTPGSSTPETNPTAKYETFADFGLGGATSTPTTTAAQINTSDSKGTALVAWLGKIGSSIPSSGAFTAVGFIHNWAVIHDVAASGMLSTLSGYRFTSDTWVNATNASWCTASGNCVTGNTLAQSSGMRPLSASFDIHSLDGQSCGRVLYTSYHTNPNVGTSTVAGENTPCPSGASQCSTSTTGTTSCNGLGFCWNPSFTDQERVLEYMLLDVGTCIKIIG
jgi:hypothetical protein